MPRPRSPLCSLGSCFHSFIHSFTYSLHNPCRDSSWWQSLRALGTPWWEGELCSLSSGGQPWTGCGVGYTMVTGCGGVGWDWLLASAIPSVRPRCQFVCPHAGPTGLKGSCPRGSDQERGGRLHLLTCSSISAARPWLFLIYNQKGRWRRWLHRWVSRAPSWASVSLQQGQSRHLQNSPGSEQLSHGQACRTPCCRARHQ